MSSPVTSSSTPCFDVARLPGRVASAVWRGSELGAVKQEVVKTGFSALDAELPGGGWPVRSLIELLQPQPSVCEWRLLGNSLRGVVQAGGELLLVSPPLAPHLPGLEQYGLKAGQLVLLDARLPAERLWATEQLIKANPKGAILAWLPQARSEQLRRLQVSAQSCQALVFLLRPAAAQFDASPAPLRLLASAEKDWHLRVQVLKRRGPMHSQPLSLYSIPESLAGVLRPQQLRPVALHVSLDKSHGALAGPSRKPQFTSH